MYFQTLPACGRKKISTWLLAVSLLASILTSCKKEEVIDYPSLFKDITWTGQLSYSNQPTQLFSVKFLTNGMFSWMDYNGEKRGTWVLEANKLSLKFTDYFSVDRSIQVIITKDKTWGDIKTADAAGLSVLSAQINPFTEQKLEGTTWKGEGAELSFATATSMKYTGLYNSQPTTITCNYIRALGCLFFPDPPSNRGIFMTQLQPDGNTMKLWLAGAKWYTLTKQ